MPLPLSLSLLVALQILTAKPSHVPNLSQPEEMKSCSIGGGLSHQRELTSAQTRADAQFANFHQGRAEEQFEWCIRRIDMQLERYQDMEVGVFLNYQFPENAGVEVVSNCQKDS